MVFVLFAGTGAKSDEAKMPVIVGAVGTTQARPLSVEWLEYWGDKLPYDRAGMQLAAELVRSENVDSDSWSERTEVEIRSAIATDDKLSRNAWSKVSCSRNGCIAVIDPLDVVNNDLITV